MAKKNNKVIITCAVTGGIHVPSMSDYLPLTPEEISKQSIDAANAGVLQYYTCTLEIQKMEGLLQTQISLISFYQL